MTGMGEGISPPGHRFRIDVFERVGYNDWEAVVYDLADHGPTLPYANISGSLDFVLRQAAHYALVAGS